MANADFPGMLLVLPDHINADGLFPFLTQLGRLQDAPEVTLDFTLLRRVTSAGLAVLAATLHRWQKERRRVSFIGLDSCPIIGYLQRMNAARMCGMTLPEQFVRHESHGRFVPLCEVGVDVEKIGHDVAACIAPGGDDYAHPMSSIYDLVWYVFTETGNNVRQHSKGVGFATAQVGDREGLVRLAIADNGCGIRRSFIDAGLPWSTTLDDSGAIREALKPRVSSKGSPTNEGVGLTLTYQLARLVSAWLLIVTGSGYARVNPGGALETGCLAGGSSYQGTLVTMVFQQNKVHDFALLMDAAKREEGLLRPSRTGGRFVS